MFDIVIENLSDEQIAAEAAEYGALAASVRRLIDATIRTERHGTPIEQACAAIDAVTESLLVEAMDGPYGVRFNETGTIRAWGNAAAGLRNPVAPPLDLKVEPDGRVWDELELGAPYEGPPTLLHGGVSALLMDQALGRSAEAAGVPGLTGTLEIRYVRATRLGRLRVEAKMERTEGVKAYARGTISDDDGVCVEATGVFIMPKWARERRAELEASREVQAASAGFRSSPSEAGHHADPPATDDEP
jgi:acyl-coenzyme A thioesterase PaaI-like protein